MAAVQVDRAQSDAMNLQVLKRQDDDVMEIVDTASHVVMYEFDQDNQNWIFVNNRLSTTNMTLAIDENLQVDSVDTFLILRCPDASYASGYAIYGVWFFPEEDREKILNLLHRVIHSLKDVPAAIPNTPTNGSVNGKQTQPKAQQQPKKVEQQVQEQQPAPQVQQQPRARSRSRNKRDDSNGRRQSGGATNAAQPTMILQRSPKNGSKAGLPPTGAAPAQHAPKQEAAEAASGMVPISREDGIAAGEAILGMISQNRTTTVTTTTTTLTTPPPQQQAPASKGRNQRKKQQQQQTDLLLPTTVSASSASFVSGSPTHAATSSTATPVNKEQLKQTLISLLDDAHFFDQIYHAYVNRVHK